jgi:tyrosyl-tRNA synthetase
MYQFFLNTEDAMVISYLKMLSFFTVNEIKEIEIKHNENPHLREAHKALAYNVISFLHGEEEYNKAVHISEVLFSGNIDELSLDEIMVGFKDVPSFELTQGPLIDILIDNNITSSKREAREFLDSGSITINGKKVTDENMIIDKNLAIEEKIIVIRKGKKKYYLGKFI